MSAKPCALCGRPADISVLLLVSTLRISPRDQQSAPAIPLCKACVSISEDSGTSTEPKVDVCLTEALTTACKALTKHSSERSDSPTATSGPTAPSADGAQSATASGATAPQVQKSGPVT
jgi:hypothetical protein